MFYEKNTREWSEEGEKTQLFLCSAVRKKKQTRQFARTKPIILN